MLVAMAAKCLAALAAGLRKKFGTYAGLVSALHEIVTNPVTICFAVSFVEAFSVYGLQFHWMIYIFFSSQSFQGGANYLGEVQGEETSGGPGLAGGH